ncbi:MAG: nucleoside triphosphate pyrophosphatase [Thiomonas sp.]|jgi:septum formation protein
MPPCPAPAAAPLTVFLASSSPRRQDLLRQAAVDFRLLAPLADEDSEALEATLPGEAPADYVQRVTQSKLDAAQQRLRRVHPTLDPLAAIVLCADTTVAIDGQILGKPRDAADAARMLRLLSGREHQVLTAVGVQRGAARHHALQVSQVRFAALSAQQITDYVASGEPFGKAGGYALQGRGAALVAHCCGSASGIIGLPLYETLKLLRAAGWPGSSGPTPQRETTP